MFAHPPVERPSARVSVSRSTSISTAAYVLSCPLPLSLSLRLPRKLHCFSILRLPLPRRLTDRNS